MSKYEEALEKTSELWNLYLEITAGECTHEPDDLTDFRKAIHDTQRILIVKAVKAGVDIKHVLR